MDMRRFLVEAKKSMPVVVTEPGSRTYVTEPWRLTRTEHGNTPLVGQELVWHDGAVTWAMAYYGSVLHDDVDVAALRQFLACALAHGDEEQPYRGPTEFIDGPWRYVNVVTGGLDEFTGRETILLNGREVYRLTYTGGWMDGP